MDKYLKLASFETWILNLVVLIPLLFSGHFVNGDAFAKACSVFLAISMASSASSILTHLLPFGAAKEKDTSGLSFPECAGLAFAFLAIGFSIAISVSIFASILVILIPALKTASRFLVFKGLINGAVVISSLLLPAKLLAGGPAIGIVMAPLLFVTFFLISYGTAVSMNSGPAGEPVDATEENEPRQPQSFIPGQKHLLSMTMFGAALACYAVFLTSSSQPLFMFSMIPAAHIMAKTHYAALVAGDYDRLVKTLTSDISVTAAISAWTLIIVMTVLFPPA